MEKLLGHTVFYEKGRPGRPLAVVLGTGPAFSAGIGDTMGGGGEESRLRIQQKPASVTRESTRVYRLTSVGAQEYTGPLLDLTDGEVLGILRRAVAARNAGEREVNGEKEQGASMFTSAREIYEILASEAQAGDRSP